MQSLQRILRRFLGLAAAALLIPACSRSVGGVVVNPNGVLSFLVAAVPVAENAGGGVVTLTVVRTGGTSGAVRVDYSTSNGSAQAGSDYANTSGTLHWAAGEGGNKPVHVPLIDDTDVEGDETFTVTLTHPTGGAVLGAAVLATVTIQDDDTPPQGVLQFSRAVYAVDENDLQVTITVTRSGGSSGAASVDLTDLGTGTASGGGVDYAFTSPETLDWDAGELGDRTAVITIVADGVLDAAPVETIDLQLQAPVGAVLGTLIDATVEITDAGSAGTIAFTAAGFNVSESAPTATIIVTRTGGKLGDASVEVAVDLVNSTAPGVDYNFTSPETVIWGDGEDGPRNVTIGIVGNDAVDGDRTVEFDLQNVSGAALGAPTTATLTIQDDEVPPSPGQLSFDAASYTVNEADGTLTFFVRRLNGSSGAVSATLATSDLTARSAASPAAKQDYVAVNQTLTWAAGVTVPIQVTITIKDNDNANPAVSGDDGSPEQFRITLSGVTGGATIAGANPVEVTIVDD